MGLTFKGKEIATAIYKGKEISEMTYKGKVITIHEQIASKNTFTGTFSSPAKETEFLKITTTVLRQQFDSQHDLTSINMPEVTNVGIDAFQHCYHLNTVKLPKVTTFGQYALLDINSRASVFINKKFNTNAEKDRIFGAYQWTNIRFHWLNDDGSEVATYVPPQTRVYRVTTQSWNAYHTSYYFKKPANFNTSDWNHYGGIKMIFVGFNPADFRGSYNAARIKFTDNGTDGRGAWDDGGRIYAFDVGDFTRHISPALKAKPYIYARIKFSNSFWKVDGFVDPDQESWLPATPE